MSFAKNERKSIDKNISKNCKKSQKHIDHTKQSTTVAFKTASKRIIQKTREATGDLIGIKIADKIIKASRIRLQNCSGAVLNEEENIRFDRERCISL